MSSTSIIFGSDHAGLPLKMNLIEHLDGQDRILTDLGTSNLDSCDYPVLAAQVCQRVLKEQAIGVLICGTGLGMSMVANRYHGIRAALCTNEYLARMARMHNNANILCMGDRVIGVELAKSILDTFLTVQFEGGRHQRRVELIDSLTVNN